MRRNQDQVFDKAKFRKQVAEIKANGGDPRQTITGEEQNAMMASYIPNGAPLKPDAEETEDPEDPEYEARKEAEIKRTAEENAEKRRRLKVQKAKEEIDSIV